MANHTGIDGLVKVSTNTVAEVQDWSITESAAVVPDSTQNDTWETNKPGMKSWSGSINALWDETDTTGQEALLIGTEVTLNLYPEGATTGDKFWTGAAIITSRGVTVPNDQGMITCAISFTGNGALTYGTVT